MAVALAWRTDLTIALARSSSRWRGRHRADCRRGWRWQHVGVGASALAFGLESISFPDGTHRPVAPTFGDILAVSRTDLALIGAGVVVLDC